jgi:hypothetical protein
MELVGSRRKFNPLFAEKLEGSLASTASGLSTNGRDSGIMHRRMVKE